MDIPLLLAQGDSVAYVDPGDDTLDILGSPSPSASSLGALERGQIVLIRETTVEGTAKDGGPTAYHHISSRGHPDGWVHDFALTPFPLRYRLGEADLPDEGPRFLAVSPYLVVDRSKDLDDGDYWYRVDNGTPDGLVMHGSKISLVTGALARRADYCTNPFLFDPPATAAGVREQLGATDDQEEQRLPNAYVKGKEDTLTTYRFPTLEVSIYRAYDGREFLMRCAVVSSSLAMAFDLGIGASEAYLERCLGAPDLVEGSSMVYLYGPDVTYQVTLSIEAGVVRRIEWSMSFL